MFVISVSFFGLTILYILTSSFILFKGDAGREKRIFIYSIIYTLLILVLYSLYKELFYSLYNKDLTPKLWLKLSDTLVIAAVAGLLCFFIIIIFRKIFYISIIISFIIFISSVWIVSVFNAGIINLVWCLVFSGAQGGYLLITNFLEDIRIGIEKIGRIESRKKQLKFTKLLQKDADKYLKLSVQVFLALAASTGVSMTILLQDGSKWGEIDLQLAATKIVLGFLFVMLGMFFSVGKPYLDISDKISKIQILLVEKENKTIEIES